jgi:hypothetical protein
MAILEEEVLEENKGVTEEELDEMVEVKEAEVQQSLVVNAFGGGLDHQTLMRYDQMAHHLSHKIADMTIAEAQQQVEVHWDPLHVQHNEDITALKGLESIKGHVLAPVLETLTKKATQHMEWAAEDLMRDGLGGKTRDEVMNDFCGIKSKEICGAEFHPIAVEVFERMVAPLATDPVQEEVQVEPAQEEKAQEQIEEEEEQKQSA